MAKQEKATWIWDASTLRSSESLLLFFEQQHVTDVYVQIDPLVSDAVYEEFIRAAHNQSIRVHALDGAPDYTDEELDGFLERVRLHDWNGIHLDIEPYLSDKWTEDQQLAVYRYEQLIKQAADSGFTLGADIPFWYDEIPSSSGGTLAEFVIDRTDYTVIMAYRDSAERILSAAKTELAWGRAAKKDVVIAVETIENAEADGISFHGKSAEYFSEELNKVAAECDCQIAVHHAQSWQKLLHNEIEGGT